MAKKYLTEYPELMLEWDWVKNDELGLNPSKITHASKKYKPFWLCSREGHSYSSEAFRRTNGRGCNICSGKSVVPGVNDIWTTNPDISSQLVEPSEGYKYSRGSDTKLDWICPEGHIWKASIYNRCISGSGCHICTGQKVDIGTTDLWSVNPILAGQLVDPKIGLSLSRSSAQIVPFRCSNGHIRSVAVYARLDDGTDCPNCVTNISGPEMVLQEKLRSLVDIVTNSRSIIPPKELDIFIPSLNIAIEYNGLYFHSDVFKGRDYHLDKSKLCWDKGIQLIHVWEDENTDVVLRMLSHKLGLSRQRRVSGSKTKVYEITGPEASAFLNENHIQGRASGSYYLGLREKSTNDLVAVMVLSRAGDVLSLDRYATSAVVMGGQSKLLSWVDRNVEYEKMITFADLSISDGSLYEKTGWNKDKVLAPDYRYVVNGKRVHKFNYRLKRFRDDPNLIFKENMSESQLAKLNNIPKIYDCGKVRYIRFPNIK